MQDFAQAIRKDFIAKASAIAEEQMKIERRSLLKSIFWQGENGDGHRHQLDDANLATFIGRQPHSSFAL